MKIINVKKLIASTLIFLFASITTPALGDEPLTYIPMSTKIEQVVLQQPPDVTLGILQISKFGKNQHYFSQNCKAELDYKSFGYKSFLSMPFTPHDSAQLLFEDQDFEISSVAYARLGGSLDATQKALLADFDLALDLTQTGSKIITTPHSTAQLLLMSGWDFRGSLPSLYFYSVLFIGAYFAFIGCKKRHKKEEPLSIHTKGWPVTMPHAARLIQLLAQHCGKIDALVVPQQEKSLWQHAQNVLSKAKGRSIMAILGALAPS